MNNTMGLYSIMSVVHIMHLRHCCGYGIGHALLILKVLWVVTDSFATVNNTLPPHSHTHTHTQIKKLVYVYLVRYAEEQQDLALLSISTFQKALKDPNQLIRASALRVLSSIRVPIIAPIMMLSIKEVSLIPLIC